MSDWLNNIIKGMSEPEEPAEPSALEQILGATINSMVDSMNYNSILEAAAVESAANAIVSAHPDAKAYAAHIAGNDEAMQAALAYAKVNGINLDDLKSEIIAMADGIEEEYRTPSFNEDMQVKLQAEIAEAKGRG